MHPDPRLHRVANGRTDLIAEILKTQDSGTWPKAEESSLLEWAAYYGDVSALRSILERGAALDCLGKDLGLNAAAFHGRWQLCEFLIENGANPKYADPATGETPLHSALTNEDRIKYDLVVQVLLRAGADPNALTIPGAETGSFMRECKTRGEGPLHRAAAFGVPATVKLLLDAGARPEQADCHGGHRIHPENKTMRENLLGSPSGERAA